MGMYAFNNSLYVSTRDRIWRFENLLALGEIYQESMEEAIAADGTADFQSASDAVIEITGFSSNLTNLAIA